MTMTEGFYVSVTPEDMRKHLRERVDYHKNRAVELTGRVETLKKNADKGVEQFAGLAEDAYGQGPQMMMNFGESASRQMNYSVAELLKTLDESILRHRVMAQSFEWVADHVGVESLKLTMAEASRFEFVDRDGIHGIRHTTMRGMLGGY